MIKTIVFDIGNVLADFDYEDCFHQFAKDEETFQKMVNATVKTEVWNEFDRGVWSEEEILQGFIENDSSIEEVLREMFVKMPGIIKQREYAIPWIRELQKKGYQVLIMSNFPKHIYELHHEKEMQFLNTVDGGILSFREHVIKPHTAIYELLMERYQLKAEECVFMDDKEENVETAMALGWKGIVFTTREKAIEELKRLGLEM